MPFLRTICSLTVHHFFFMCAYFEILTAQDDVGAGIMDDI